MKQIALAAELNVDCAPIEAAINSDHKLNCRKYDKVSSLIDDLRRDDIDAIVLGIRLLNDKKSELLNSIKKIIRAKPLVLIGNEVCNSIENQRMQLNQSIFCLNKLETVHLPGILKKMLKQAPVSTRRYLRYDVKLKATTYKSNFCQNIRIENISKGGLLIKNTGSHFQADERFLIEIPGSKGQKSYYYTVQTTWRKVVPCQKQQGQFHQLLGGKFVKADEIAA